MTRIPLFGSEPADPRIGAPRVRTRSLWCWRAWDGQLAPLNEGLSVAYRGRTSAATIHASDGTSGTLAAAAAAFTAIDWDGDGVREEDALLLSDEEALRYFDASTGGLWWDMGPKVLRLDGVELGNAVDEDAPYWSFTTDDIAGAYLAVLGAGDLGDGVGGIRLRHHNGTSAVESVLPLPASARFSLRGLYHADGAVQIGLVVNGAAEVLGLKSAALTPAASWGAGGTPQLRVNEIGTATRGTFALRYGAVFGGLATRPQLLEVL